MAATNLNEYYTQLGKKLPTLQERQGVATKAGIQGYRGTAEQNTQLLSYLQKTDGMAKVDPNPPAENTILKTNPVVDSIKTIKKNMSTKVEQPLPQIPQETPPTPTETQPTTPSVGPATTISPTEKTVTTEKATTVTPVAETIQTPPAQPTPTQPTQEKPAQPTEPVKTRAEIVQERIANRKLQKNLGAYRTGEDLYKAVNSGIMAEGTAEYNALAQANPDLINQYVTYKKDKAKKEQITTLGNVVLGNPTNITPTSNSEAFLNKIMSSFDEDIATTYKNIVTNDPNYIEAVNTANTLKTQLAEVNNNINKIGDDTRKLYTGEVPESVIASDVARRAKPLIQQAQFLQDQIEIADNEANRIMDENRDFFTMQVEDRRAKQNLAFQLYGTIRAEEIRQEDIMREDDRLQKEIAREEMLYQRGKSDKLDELKAQEEYNLSVGLLDKGIDPTGLTVEEMRSKYAESTRTTIASQKALDWAKVKPSGSTEAPQFKPVFNDDGTMKISENSVYNLAIGPDGNSVQVQGIQEGGYAPNGRTECGAFVNDLIGAKIFGDQLSDKTKNINSNTPVVGGAFIEDVGPYGHVGFIESINPDGSINIIDSNYSKDTDGKIRRDTIAVGSPRWNQIKGFYDPSVGGPAPLDSNTRVILNQEKSAFRSNPVIKAFEEGLQQYKDIAVSLNDTSGPGDTAGIFQFMKSLDPNSVVRETEFEAAAKSAGVFEYIGNTYDRITKGKKLSPDQALAFKRLAKAYVENRADSYDRLYDDMARTVENNGIHPSYLPTRASDELKSGNNQFQPTKTDTKETYSEYDNLRAEVATPYSIGTAESVNINKNTPGLTFQ